MERSEVARWLDAYVEAWKSYDPEAIGGLFSDDCLYRYHPADEPLRGREQIVTSWLEDDPDAPGTYDAAYAPVAVDGRRRGRGRRQHLPRAGGRGRAGLRQLLPAPLRRRRSLR